MNREFLISGFKVVLVAILFAICGYYSASYFLPNFPDRMDAIFPLPFALLCAVVFMRNVKAIFAIGPVYILWAISSFVAYGTGMEHPSPLLPGLVGGLIGGLGLVLCFAICHPTVLSWMSLAIGGLVGAVAGIAFGPWTHLYMEQHYGDNINRTFPRVVPITAFVIWQAAMGTYLYWTFRNSVRSLPIQGSSGGI